jgi:hypothetical protein
VGPGDLIHFVMRSGRLSGVDSQHVLIRLSGNIGGLIVHSNGEGERKPG